VGNLKRRLERLERLHRSRKQEGIVLICVGPGETSEEVIQRHLAQHPEDKDNEEILYLIIDASGWAPKNQDSSPQSPGSDGKIPEKCSPKTRMIR